MLSINFFLFLIVVPTQLLASEDYAQQKEFSIRANNKSVKEVLEYIKKNSEFVFLYSQDLLPILQKKVSFSVENRKIEIILEMLCKETGLKYTINDRQITLFKAVEEEKTPQQKRQIKVNPEKPDVPLNKNDAFQKVQKRRVQEKR